MSSLIWKGFLRYMLACLLITLGIAGCNNDSNDAEIKSSHNHTFAYNLSNKTDDTPLSNLEVNFVFDVTNQPEDFTVTIKDVLGREVAGYKSGGFYQNNIVLVPKSGIVPLSIDVSNVLSASDATGILTIITHGRGFFSNSKRLNLSKTSVENSYWVEVVPKSSNDSIATSYAEQTISLTGSAVASTAVIVTPVKSTSTVGGNILDGASASLTIPAGTSLLAADGSVFEPIGNVTASIMVFSADPKTVSGVDNNPLYLFPGGLSPENLDGDLPENINSSELTFISAGFVAIELEDSAGNQVAGFEGNGVNLTFDVPKSTINPETGAALTINDASIPVWSYTDSNGRWRYEGDAPIVSENTNTFTLSKEISHLSYYNLDWYRSNRCKLEIDVVDQNGAPNNQKLRLSFAKEGGGWAYKPSGWGPNPEKLEINRVPAFAGHFDLLDSQSNSLLASIEVDGEVTPVSDEESGLDLTDFCFGVSTDETKTFKATLNITNPPRIDLQPSLTLACPIDTGSTLTATSGRFYLYSGYSYEMSGEISGETISLDNLIEDARYRLYYYGNQTWGQVEFTASEGLSNIQLTSLAACDKVNQTINSRLVCLDDNQSVVRHRSAPSAWYWMYNRDYSHYLWGQTNEEGTAQEARVVDTVQYEGSAYIRLDNRYYWGTRKTVTGSAGQNIVFDISLPSDNAFCTEELTIDYDTTSISGSPLTALANGSSTITITVQERNQFGEARSENSGVLALIAAPSAGVSITNIQSMGDGTYTALVSSNKVQSVTISGTIDDNPLGGNVTLSFTPVVDIANSTWTLNQSSASADGTDSITATLQLVDMEGNNYTSSAGTLEITPPANLSTSAVTDNQDGTYQFSMTSLVAGDYEVEATIGSNSITQKASANFSAAVSLSNSTVEASTSSINADGSSASVITVTLRDYAGNAFVPTSGNITLNASGSANTSTPQSSSDGIYTSSVTSTQSGSETITAKLGSQTIGSVSVEFVPAFSVSNSSFTLSSQSVDADGSTASIATIVLRDFANEIYVPGSGTVTLSHTGTATVPVPSHDGNGTYTSSITSSTAGSVNVTATFDSQDIGTLSITFNGTGPSADNSTVALATSALDIADSTSVTLVLKTSDGQDYGQSGGTLVLDSSPSGLSFQSVTDNGDGSYTATVSSSSVGNYSVLAEVGGLTLTASPSITFTEVDATATSLSATSVSQNMGETSNVTLSVRQSDNSLVGHGNHIITLSGIALTLELVRVQTTDNNDGTYTLAVTCNSTYSGSLDITVDVDANSNVDTLSIMCSNN
ncbi:Ig-like domain-containing protein [Vibrio hangzhouensis]|uniref:Adhesin/invasin n=1 Tax=Vibrio hangzhouensis TaxID=462991 RepID=A0A1H5ZNC8_9VIBR|nr:Ig-like domain-containing protein [Vibrio hangzhouensis]SEG37702.1 adhesin/invasin [Vibrio hangzhouensis]